MAGIVFAVPSENAAITGCVDDASTHTQAVWQQRNAARHIPPVPVGRTNHGGSGALRSDREEMEPAKTIQDEAAGPVRQ